MVTVNQAVSFEKISLTLTTGAQRTPSVTLTRPLPSSTSGLVGAAADEGGFAVTLITHCRRSTVGVGDGFGGVDTTLEPGLHGDCFAGTEFVRPLEGHVPFRVAETDSHAVCRCAVVVPEHDRLVGDAETTLGGLSIIVAVVSVSFHEHTEV